MLTKLNIQNYALINDVSITFSKGFTTITGETGAGKSIMLGALGLVLGNRADSNALMDKTRKCIIEAEFDIQQYGIRPFFKKNDIDYEDQTIVRRELLPSGKSRAFINDTPVKLSLLTELQQYLIDIHSQHQTLQLNDTNFQFQLLDALAGVVDEIQLFRAKHREYKALSDELVALKQQLQQAQEQQDYISFLYDELEKAAFKKGEQEVLESNLERYSNSELIQQNLANSFVTLSKEELGIIDQLFSIKTNLNQIKNFSKEYTELAERLDSVYIELKDIETEMELASETVLFDPEALNKTNERLQLLYNLLQKHHVNNLSELLIKQSELEEKILQVTQADGLLQTKEENIAVLKKDLFKLGKSIHTKRIAVIPELEQQIVALLKELGISDAQFKILLEKTAHFYRNGMDEIQWLFNANKGGNIQSLKQVASGGELSRIMLAIKSLMATHTKLPTILFDEIDTGVSGEISLKMGEIMAKMAQAMQVISITHLPQIAAKGITQMKVYKDIENGRMHTTIKTLTDRERIHEIAEMLGGKNILETAEKHALQLLQLKK